jgi:DNA repair protein RecO (recombination protein O)
MAYVEVVWYHRPTRDIQTLKEVSHVRPFLGLSRRLDKMAVGLRVVELVHALMQPDEQNPEVFALTTQVLDRVNDMEGPTENLLSFFQLRLAGILGFRPAITKEQADNIPAEGGMLLLDRGDVVAAGGSSARKASRSALRAFAVFAHAPMDIVQQMTMSDPIRREAQALVDAYLHYHVEDAYPTRGEKILGALLRRPS